MKIYYKKESQNIFVTENSIIKDCLNDMNKNRMGLVFVLSNVGKLVGSITDGDIRRGLLSNVSIKSGVSIIMNKSPKFVDDEADEDTIRVMLGTNYKEGKVKFLAVVDKSGYFIGYYSYFDLARIPVAQPHLLGNESKYLQECIEENWISSSGRFISSFEESFKSYLNVKHALTVSNGTTALHLALVALGIGHGDEVIIPSLTFIATANAVKYTGATPVFVDVEMDTWNLNPDLLSSVYTEKTKAIIVVHLYGQPAKLDQISSFAKSKGIYLVEDAAEAQGAEFKEKRVGAFGDIATFSFFGNKIITTGEGGMLVTNNKAFYHSAKLFRDHGMSTQKRYWHDVVGYNYRMTNLQAAVGFAQMEKIESIIQKKIDIAGEYEKNLSGNPNITLPPKNDWSKNVFWLYTILINIPKDRSFRDELLNHLNDFGIESRPVFYPIHEMPPYRTNHQLPNTKIISENGISLPSFPSLTNDAIRKICSEIKKFINNR